MMFGRGWKIGSIAGIPIKLDGSWVWIAVLYTYTLYANIRREGFVVSQGQAIALAVFSAALFFGSVLVHELAHAGTARALGIPVAGVTLVFWGGFTETRAERRGPVGEFLVSAAGPASTIVLSGLFWLLSRATADTTPALSRTFAYLAFINVLLAILNSLPGFPLDGGRALLALVWKVTGDRRKATRVASVVGMGVATALGALGVVALTRENLSFALYAFFIAYMMFAAARSSGGRLALEQELAGGTVREAMGPPPTAIPAELSLSEALDRYFRGHEHESFPVVHDGRVVGVASFHTARRVGGRDPLRPVRDAMVPLGEALTVRPDKRLDEVLDTLGRGRAALVVEDGEPVGSIGASDVEAWLRTRRGQPQPVPPRPDR